MYNSLLVVAISSLVIRPWSKNYRTKQTTRSSSIHVRLTRTSSLPTDLLIDDNWLFDLDGQLKQSCNTRPRILTLQRFRRRLA